MATARRSRQTSRTLKVGRVGRTGRVPPAARGTGRLEARRNGPIIDTSRLSRIARRRIASPPMAAVDRVGEAVHAAVLRWAEAFIARVMRDVVPSIVKADATEDDIDAILNALDDPELSKKLMEEAFKSVDKASADDLRVVGVQTSSVVRNAEQLQAEWLRQSTDLIRATEDVRRRVERILKDPISEGRSVADIRGMLIEQAGYAASRAELTARTVTLQTYGKIQEQRQRDAGFTKYVWTTSLDERVREDHAELDGTVQGWDSPPIADKRTGIRAHPGGVWNCRCSAVPYADPDEAAEPPPVEPEPAVAPTPAPPPVEDLVAQAQSIDIRRSARATAPDQIQQAVQSGLPGKSLEDLTAIPFSEAELRSEAGLEFLRKDPTFLSTGNVADNFGSSPAGLPQIQIEADGSAHLINGRHRLTVAREVGLRQIVARVRRYGPRGGLLWDYIGPIRV